MSVLKIKWSELLENKPVLTFEEFDSLFASIDELLVQKIDESLSSVSPMKDIYDDVVQNYLVIGDTNNWNDLDIWLSSFKKNDTRIFGMIRLKILQYLGFYKKVLTDNGVARSVVTRRTYSDKNTSTGENSAGYSETPQVDISGGTIPTFEDMMKYLSNVSRNKDEIETNREGESDLDVKSKTWDEEMKNLNMVFYNNLCEYIINIPKIIYYYYSLEMTPIPDLVSKEIEYVRALRDIYEHR